LEQNPDKLILFARHCNTPLTTPEIALAYYGAISYPVFTGVDNMSNTHFVIAKNEVDAKFLAERKFQSNEKTNSALGHVTSKQKVYKAFLSHDGNVIITEHKKLTSNIWSK
jgi:hypothetical protein